MYSGNYHGGASRSTDGGVTWTDIDDGFNGQGVRSLAIAPGTPSIVYAGTSSGGIFRYDAVTSYALTTVASPLAGGTITRSPEPFVRRWNRRHPDGHPRRRLQLHQLVRRCQRHEVHREPDDRR